MPLDLEKFTDKKIMNILVYGRPNKKDIILLWNPLALLPCNLCGWYSDIEQGEFNIALLLYVHGIGGLCQGCQINLFWELKKRNLSLNIGKVVFS